MSRITDFCDDGMCAALAVVLAVFLLLLALEFVCLAVGSGVAACWNAVRRLGR